MSSKLTITIPVCLDLLFVWPLMVYRRHKYGYAYRRIPLGEGRFTIVEPQDFYWLNNFHWTLDGNGEHIYAVRNTMKGGAGTKTISLHREIMNHPKGLLVDHRNTDTLDNRRSNLRLATHSQNSCNRRKTKSKTSSQYTGVYFHRKKGRWCAAIKLNQKVIWLGYFKNEIDAAKAYDSAAKKYHGEFARLNFPESADSV